MQFGATCLNLASIITHHARLTPENEAIVCDSVRLTYGELDKLSNCVANALMDLGIRHGDKVALSCPNLPSFPVVYYGIMKAGAVVVPLNVLFTQRDFEYHLKDSDAKAVFVFEGTDDLPMGERVKAACEKVPTCEHVIRIAKDVSKVSL